MLNNSHIFSKNHRITLNKHYIVQVKNDIINISIVLLYLIDLNNWEILHYEYTKYLCILCFL